MLRSPHCVNSVTPVTVITSYSIHYTKLYDTAYKEFAIDGYELNVTDYLLKPFSFERFLKAINKVVESMENKSNPFQSLGKDESEASLHENYLVIRADRKHYKINYDDLIRNNFV